MRFFSIFGHPSMFRDERLQLCVHIWSDCSLVMIPKAINIYIVLNHYSGPTFFCFWAKGYSLVSISHLTIIIFVDEALCQFLFRVSPVWALKLLVRYFFPVLGPKAIALGLFLVRFFPF